MSRTIADGLSEKGAKNIEEIDAQTIKIKGVAIGSMAERDVYISQDEPSDTEGEDGDIWLQYEA